MIAVRSSIILILGVLIATLNSAILARLLGVEGRAEFYLLFLPLYFSPIISATGLSQLGVYIIKQFKKQDYIGDVRRISFNSFLFALVWMLFALYFLIPKLNISIFDYCLLTFFICISFSIATYTSVISSLDDTFILPDTVKLFNPILNLIFIGLIYCFFSMTPLCFMVAQGLVKLVEFSFVTYLMPKVFKRQNVVISKNISYNYKVYRIKSWLTSINSLVFQHLDKIIILFLATKNEIGIYAVSAGLSMNANQFVGNLVNIFIARLKVRNRGDVKIQIINTTKKFALAGIVGLILSFLFVDDFIVFVFSSKFIGSAVFANILFLKIYFSILSWLLAQYFVLFGENEIYLQNQYISLIVILIGFIVSYTIGSFYAFVCFSAISSFLGFCFMFVRFYKR